MRSSSLRLGLVALLVIGSAGSIVRADSIVFTGTVVGSGSDKTDDDHAKTYSGEYEVTFEYTIAIKKNPDGTFMFDPAGMSTVKITDTSAKFGSFTTLPIKITGATVSSTDGSVSGFEFSSTDWYPNADTDGIKNNGLTGHVTISDNTASVTSSYIDNNSGSIYKYEFTATPEPAEWVMTLTGLGVLLVRRAWRRRVAAWE